MTIYHKHHIIPRHAGGTDEPSNLVLLTIEEHAEAHRQLYEKYGRWQDYYAYQLLQGNCTKQDVIKASWHCPIRNSKISDTLKGRNLTIEHRENISKSRTGQKMPDGHGEKIAAKTRGIPKSEETKKRMRKPKSDRTKEHCDNLSKSLGHSIIIDGIHYTSKNKAAEVMSKEWNVSKSTARRRIDSM